MNSDLDDLIVVINWLVSHHRPLPNEVCGALNGLRSRKKSRDDYPDLIHEFNNPYWDSSITESHE